MVTPLEPSKRWPRQYIAGTIYHICEEKSQNAGRKAGVVTRMYLSDSSHFEDIIISGRIFQQHLPSSYQFSLGKVMHHIVADEISLKYHKSHEVERILMNGVNVFSWLEDSINFTNNSDLKMILDELVKTPK
eukprot:TRINITY_DN21056_c0_g1_i1.p2 TRINITY_DN21056_c0_g1~~TRINITY_DN21056_c0_g1_i1.p2  ORF type:complete len:132 (+),score=34.23 TRINITY_DN21056_c0_g1_i1:331-726(+)